MARIRSIKPEFFSHEELASKSPHARLLAIGLLTLADCEGRLRWVPMQVHSQVFPWEAEVNIEALLRELVEVSYVVHYEVDGKRYVEIINFRKHQRLTGKEAAYSSKLPPMPKRPNKTLGETGEASREKPDVSQGSTQMPLGTGEQGNRGTEDIKSAKRGHSYSDEFEKFWLSFPKTRRTKKGGAYEKWQVAIKSTDHETLTRRAAEYSESPKGRSEYAVMPSVWLHNRMWEDDPAAWGESSATEPPDDYELMKRADWAYLTGESGNLELHSGLQWNADYTDLLPKSGWRIDRTGRCPKVVREGVLAHA